MGSISRNFSWSEFERTSHLDLRERNMLADEGDRLNCKALVDAVLQPLRDALGVPLAVSSGYRCAELNKRVGGAADSMHLTASAADVGAAGLPPCEVARTARDLRLPYDQMILYPTFVHISHRRDGEQRGQVLYDKSYVGERL